MTSTTPRGAPYPDASDSNDVPADIHALATWVNDRPGVATLTTTQRNALSGAALWDGRLIYNSTTIRFERYKSATTSWVTVIDGLPVIIARDVQVFDSSGTWTKPSGATRVTVRLVGGGCAGFTNAASGIPGGNGAYLEVTLPASAFGATSTVTVGAGGAPSGGVGGDTSVTTATSPLIAKGATTGEETPHFAGAVVNGITIGEAVTGTGLVGTSESSMIVFAGSAFANPTTIISTGAGPGGRGSSGAGTRGAHATFGLRAGGNPGSAGAAGDIANGICGSGGGGGGATVSPTGGAGGKYGGGGGGGGPGGAAGGAGGQGGVAFITHFD